eukprot:Rmarinus@m.16954
MTGAAGDIHGEEYRTFDISFLQAFGALREGEVADEDDLITAIDFDSTGEHIATGDHMGRVILFQREPSGQRYRFYQEIHSHMKEFDTVNSAEVSGAITQVRWPKRRSNASLVLTSNERCVKLWKVHERKVVGVGDTAVSRSRPASLKLPKLVVKGKLVEHDQTRVWRTAGHTEGIHSVSLNSDDESFLTADPQKINVHRLEFVDNAAYNVLDMQGKDSPAVDETDWVTSAKFHPRHSYLMVYGSTTGLVRLCDMRTTHQCEKHFDTVGKISSSVVASVSDLQLCDNFILVRDFMKVQLFDIRSPAKAIEVRYCHEHLRSKLWDIYEQNNKAYDKFECAFSTDQHFLCTGAYGNTFRVFDYRNRTEAAVDPTTHFNLRCKPFQTAPSRSAITRQHCSWGFHNNEPIMSLPLVHIASHPKEGLFAVGAGRSLCLLEVSNLLDSLPKGGAAKAGGRAAR